MRMLERAQRILDAGLPEDAARCAYLATFHTAEALIIERSGKIAKSHMGVQSEFSRLTLNIPNVDPELRAFLRRAYNLKTHADYFSGPIDEITISSATQALETARRFVAHFSALIDPKAQQ